MLIESKKPPCLALLQTKILSLKLNATLLEVLKVDLLDVEREVSVNVSVIDVPSLSIVLDLDSCIEVVLI